MRLLKQGDLVKWSADSFFACNKVGILLQILSKDEFPGLIEGDVLCSDGKRYRIYLKESMEDL